jgi:Kef-type K+ transport system membrane component KefB
MLNPDRLSPGAGIVSWIGQLAAAVILGQTLYFKFTAAAESVYIFSTLGMEPWGRIGTGVLELVAVVLLLVPGSSGVGALLAMGLMSGAIFFHLTRLGIEVKGDSGLLFGLALAAFAASAVVVLLRWRRIPVLGDLLAARMTGRMEA